MTIDHIGVAVRSIDKGAELWERLFGYKRIGEPVINTRQKVKVLFLRKEDSIDVKLIEPTDQSSPAFGAVKAGGGLHHICFRTDSVEHTVEELQSKGCRVLFPPQPGEAFCNELIAFLYAGLGLNFELIDTDKRA